MHGAGRWGRRDDSNVYSQIDDKFPFAHCWHFWYSPVDAVIYAAFILLGKIVWHMVDFGVSVKAAAYINRLISNRKRKG